MKTFIFTVKDNHGKVRTFEVQAANRDHAVQKAFNKFSSREYILGIICK